MILSAHKKVNIHRFEDQDKANISGRHYYLPHANACDANDPKMLEEKGGNEVISPNKDFRTLSHAFENAHKIKNYKYFS